eukprot:Cvel_14699.t2-p1 / transcript=Cvel_14699.t2 / gene=Cvel_14699 / organism=Chromera_velia_CCMP2878 / gene_product=hypothetical protein / transcript_product=hypothetical protein / location=Cvel_scaffold1055:30227-30898(-) / protein_length=224 / sequence_SO=supercontig / SO=protein_coding / is_pseudo=false
MIWAYHPMRGAFRPFNKKNPTYNSNPGGYKKACVNDTERAKSVLRAGLQGLHTILEECKYEEVKVKAVLESAVKACREGRWSDRGRIDGDRGEESKRMGGDGKWNPTGAFFGPTEDGGVLWGSAAEAAGEEYRARPQSGDAEFPLRGDGWQGGHRHCVLSAGMEKGLTAGHGDAGRPVVIQGDDSPLTPKKVLTGGGSVQLPSFGISTGQEGTGGKKRASSPKQ